VGLTWTWKWTSERAIGQGQGGGHPSGEWGAGYFHLTATRKWLKKRSSPEPTQEEVLVKVIQSWRAGKHPPSYGATCQEDFQDYINHPIKQSGSF